MTSQIETEERGGVFWITFNRPEKANAISAKMWRDIAGALEEGSSSPRSRVIAITGKGRFFSAGEDMLDFNKAKTFGAAFDLFIGKMRPVFGVILACPKPVIAAVNGPAIGAGTELVIACDLAVASRNATFSLSQGRYGIGPALGLTLGIPVLGRKRLTEMALTGQRVGASEARKLGLVNRVAKGKLETAVEKLAEEISETPPTLIRAMKEVLLKQMSLVGYENAFTFLAMYSQSQDSRQGTTRFLSKSR